MFVQLVAAGSLRKLTREAQRYQYLILSDTQSHSLLFLPLWLHAFLGLHMLEESLRSMNQPLCNYVYVTSDVQRFHRWSGSLCCNAAVIVQGSGVHCGMVSAGVSLVDAQWLRHHLPVHSLSQLWWRRLD